MIILLDDGCFIFNFKFLNKKIFLKIDCFIGKKLLIFYINNFLIFLIYFAWISDGVSEGLDLSLIWNQMKHFLYIVKWAFFH